MSTLKKAENRQEVILRLSSPAKLVTCDVIVASNREAISCSETTMDEHIITEED